MIMKELPRLFDTKEECCGCSACYLICPTNAIYMLEDQEGFEYPHIYADKCIQCYKCKNICDFKSD